MGGFRPGLKLWCSALLWQLVQAGFLFAFAVLSRASGVVECCGVRLVVAWRFSLLCMDFSVMNGCVNVDR